MESLSIQSDFPNPDFTQAKQLADTAADSALNEPILLSWFDRMRNREYPPGISECNDTCDTPGCITYAENRDGKLTVDINQGEYLFCYRELGEFAE